MPRVSRFRTVGLCQVPPGAVRTPRLFNAVARLRSRVTTVACISRTLEALRREGACGAYRMIHRRAVVGDVKKYGQGGKMNVLMRPVASDAKQIQPVISGYAVSYSAGAAGLVKSVAVTRGRDDDGLRLAEQNVEAD